jgi:hypothetical protein
MHILSFWFFIQKWWTKLKSVTIMWRTKIFFLFFYSTTCLATRTARATASWTPSRCQFHQHFTCTFFEQKCFAHFFLNYIQFGFVILWCKNTSSKADCKMLMKLTKGIRRDGSQMRNVSTRYSRWRYHAYNSLPLPVHHWIRSHWSQCHLHHVQSHREKVDTHTRTHKLTHVTHAHRHNFLV